MVRLIWAGVACSCSAVTLQEHQMELSSEASKILDSFSSAMLNPQLSGAHDISSTMRSLAKHMDVNSAAKAVAHKGLSYDVQNLVQRVGDGTTSAGEFSEESLAKARKALNDLIEKAWVELDDKMMQCKGFEDMNRENYAQVTRDIARLISQINDLERIESEAVDGINQKDSEITGVEELLNTETQSYNTDYAANSAELTTRQNDLDVFQFILQFTKCEDATSFSQVKLCSTHAGEHMLVFHDAKTDAKFRSILTPSVRKSVSAMLQTMVKKSTAKETPVADGASSIEASLQCNPDQVPDCALLHDKLSLMWGEFKDKVDELTMTMMKNEYEFNELKNNLNSQITMLRNAKSQLNQLLGEARSNLANDNEELTQKYTQKSNLDKQYVKYMAACKKRIDWIFYQDMCAIKIVRNAVLENSTECPPTKMTDCDVGDWVPAECSVSCDDSCDPRKPYQCGGWQEMRREVVVPNDDCGVKCPRTTLMKRCGQYHCPINCEMSAWSGWSKCSAECGGGLQSKTRSILVKPMNGGLSCNTVEESQPCATESCDRDCSLARWTAWSPCSMACSPGKGDYGFQEKYRHVARPTRGHGKCPSATSGARYRKQSCNEHDCRGDEICVANQDLVIAIDGSGSVREQGFNTLKTFVERLLARYQTQYWGSAAVKIGIVLFGNGVIMPDGKTVSPAIIAQELTFDMAAVTGAVSGLPFKKGFTNMAQAFSAAEQAFIIGSRRGSQSAVMVITDGKPSFSFMTTESVEQLDDKGVQRYFMVVTEEDINSAALTQMKAWASQPWETNLVHVPGGLELLEADTDLWADKALVKFCPNAYSPSEGEWEEVNYGYAHVMDGAYCGEMVPDNLLGKVDDVEQCAALVAGAEGQSFIYGVSWAAGKCYKGTIDVDQAQFDTFLANKKDPQCPGDKRTVTLYDFYAMEPLE
jgi:hypothetical protein